MTCTSLACGARSGPPTERSHVQTTPRLACRLSYAPCSTSSLLASRSEVHTSVCRCRAKNHILAGERLPPLSHLYHGAGDYNCRKCDSLLHLGDKKFCRSEMKINTAPYFSTAQLTWRRSFREMRYIKR